MAATTPRPDGLGDNIDPKVRCAAFECIQAAEGNFAHGSEAPEFCIVHNRDIRVFRNWLDARRINRGAGGSFKAARMFWDGTLT
jgi:hypothetical protein